MNHIAIARKITQPIIGHIHKLIGVTSPACDAVELSRLLRIPRYAPGVAHFSKCTINYSDAESLYHQYREIIGKEIYKFSNDTQAKHRIIDCGSNVGLGCIFARLTYPNAHITAFEPNPTLFELLTKNTTGMNIELIQSAVWTDEGTMALNADTADASSLTHTPQKSSTVTVKTERLSKYLTEPVDFVKIDIEGAETEVIKEISPLLHNVKNLFIEYHCEDLRNKNLLDILGILTTAGFTYYITPQSVPRTPFIHKKKEGSPFYFQVNIFASQKS
jgi:FkbM family methyltransferase